MIFGRGGGRNFWIFRVGILVLLLTAGSAFHYKGAGYWTVRGLYYALIFGFILTAVWRGKARQRGMGTGGSGQFPGPAPYQQGGMPPPFGGRYSPYGQQPSYGGQYPPMPSHVDSPPSVAPADNPPSVPVEVPPAGEPAAPSIPEMSVGAERPAAAPPSFEPPVPVPAPTPPPVPAAPAAPAPSPAPTPSGQLQPVAERAIAMPVSHEAAPDHAKISAPEKKAGWYPDPLDPMARHYWDGGAWTYRLKWDGKGWVPV